MIKEKAKGGQIIKIILCILGVIIILAGYFAISMYMEYQRTGEGTEETVSIKIVQGEGAWDIAAKLKEKDLIQYEVVFYLKARNMGVANKLRYGEFTFQKDSGLENIIEVLTTGGAQKDAVMFTVPEGYTIELIAEKLEKEGVCTKSDFLAAVNNEYAYWFLEDIPVNEDIRYRLQGFLYPETYAIHEDMDAEDIVKVMLNQFDKLFTEEMHKKMDSLGKNIFEVVIEASIIERETGIEEEKPIIAGVIKNRLEISMKLQMCPTVLYPITDGLYGKNTVTYDDIAVDTPYNTYMYEGLPVGPICCPSISSIEAVLNPDENSYFFYHANSEKNDGSHIFTETYEEHIKTQ
ncbi:MAG: endolytic transglycosylase MltG [Agathobacter sp.]|nr:endolytic transglycosylase MltG [Agathobacter sp.]